MRNRCRIAERISVNALWTFSDDTRSKVSLHISDYFLPASADFDGDHHQLFILSQFSVYNRPWEPKGNALLWFDTVLFRVRISDIRHRWVPFFLLLLYFWFLFSIHEWHLRWLDDSNADVCYLRTAAPKHASKVDYKAQYGEFELATMILLSSAIASSLLSICFAIFTIFTVFGALAHCVMLLTATICSISAFVVYTYFNELKDNQNETVNGNIIRYHFGWAYYWSGGASAGLFAAFICSLFASACVLLHKQQKNRIDSVVLWHLDRSLSFQATSCLLLSHFTWITATPYHKDRLFPIASMTSHLPHGQTFRVIWLYSLSPEQTILCNCTRWDTNESFWKKKFHPQQFTNQDSQRKTNIINRTKVEKKQARKQNFKKKAK